jgi:hypothetical protein
MRMRSVCCLTLQFIFIYKDISFEDKYSGDIIYWKLNDEYIIIFTLVKVTAIR